MAKRDPVSRSKGSQDVTTSRNESNPFLALHREMNRLFDDAFRSFEMTPFTAQPVAWPNIEVIETEKELKVVAELPGLDEKDVNIELTGGLLTISGEKKSETEDKERRFSEPTMAALNGPFRSMTSIRIR